MATTLTKLITDYRKHAAAQRRMIERRNRQYLAAGGEGDRPAWSERAFEANERHQEALGAIAAQLQDAHRWALAYLLADEARVTRMLSWSRMSGKDNADALATELTEIRRNIRRLAAPRLAAYVAEFRRHAAALRKINKRASESAKSAEARGTHRDICTQITSDLMFVDEGELAFALESENNYLRQLDNGVQVAQPLAVVRRVIRRAVARSSVI